MDINSLLLDLLIFLFLKNHCVQAVVSFFICVVLINCTFKGPVFVDFSVHNKFQNDIDEMLYMFVFKEGETPLIKATKMRNIEIVELLLDKGAKVSAVDKVLFKTHTPVPTNIVMQVLL